MRMPAAIGVLAALLALAAPTAAQPALSPDPAVALTRGPSGRAKLHVYGFQLVPSWVRVGDPEASAASQPAQGASGLYLATVRRMVFRATGGTDWVTETEFYLLSPDGRVQRGHGLPEVPGGDLRRFDYESARRADPGNSGSYATSGNQVTITFGEERISATRAGADELEIRGTRFKRSVK
jgi:hypothetical protein